MKADDLIPDACPKGWDELDGDGRRRRCGACGRDVVDLSAMTRAEALATVVGERPCVRVEADGRGQVRFRAGRLARLAAALGLGLAVHTAHAEDTVCDPVAGVAFEAQPGVVFIGRVQRGGLLASALRARYGTALATVRTGPNRFRRLVVTCRGFVGRDALWDGTATVRDIPAGEACTATLKGGPEPGQQIVFTPGTEVPELCLGNRIPAPDEEVEAEAEASEDE